MAQYAMITQNGLNQIDNSHPLGQYLEIAYYLPVYDYRIDPNILPTDTSISGTEISTCTSSTDLVPQGEVLWNVSGSNDYTLSTEQTYLVRTGDETVSTSGSNMMVTNFAHREVFSINKFKTSAISDYYTGDTVVSPGTGGSEWFISNAGYSLLSAPSSATGFGPEDHENPTSQFLYKGVSYQHVITSANDSRANFKVTMRAEHGQIKFNKIGLYGVKRTADGVIVADPFLFGQVIIPEPQILYSKDTGSGKMTEITLDFQIESKTLSAGMFEEVFYSTSGDYWVRTTNEENGNYGLSYDGSVYISNTLGIDETGAVLGGDLDRSVAKLLVSTFEYVNKPVTSAERDMSQLCLQYVSSQGIESKRIRTTMRTNVSGDCEFDMYGACLSGHPDNYSVIPAFDKEYGLGLKNNRWSHLYLSDKFDMFDNTWAEVTSGSDFSDGYISFNLAKKSANFGNTNVYVGPYHNTTKIKFDGATFLKRIDNTQYVHGNISSYRVSAEGTDVIDGSTNTYTQDYDLLVRGLNDIALITLSAGVADTFTAEEVIDKIWTTYNISQTTITENENIIAANLVRITEIDIEIPTFTSTPVGLIQEKNGLLFENQKLTSQNKTIQSQIDGSIIPYLGEDKDILLVAGRNIHTHGNVIPLQNLVNDLGWWDNQFAHVFTQNITGWNRDDGNGRQVAFQGHIVPDGTGHKIKENSWTGWEWSEITAKNLGRSSKYIERAYIKRIDTDYIKLPDDGLIEFNGGIKISQSSIFGNINNIGTDENPVNILYLNDLVLKNIYKTYIHSSFTLAYNHPQAISFAADFGTPGGFFDVSDVMVRYNDIAQNGILYLTIAEGVRLGRNTKTFPRDSDKRIMTLKYAGILATLGLSSMSFKSISKYEQEQNIFVDTSVGTKEQPTTFPGYVTEASDITGLYFNAKYSKVTGFQKVREGNTITVKNQDIVLAFDIKGVLNPEWSLDS